ncbi:DNA cytosine methyltransferase [Phytopseudomonas punonensis]|uniref:DNA (Cytosine-5)-methyltransferase 1 n=1 Tax=Phytopseudomonas punonensis TaxID=1220495 RepID=A0A1M7LL54_9GAMM|nr:DNA cytosine methyltransferase [Pseudomonas punonensis]SHM78866.1 DNA (cytosine-5)-methyltransferase 1 [Pseudomonas punonensis]
MPAYYNEHDPYAAQWLRNLIAAGHIAAGDVDERSIEDVHPDDLKPYTQCHFFAGVGVWSLALRRAGWSDDRPVWTGSCPCQPFSAAGQGAGFDDERHLWPAFAWLIGERQPPVIFGEQVASKDAGPWLDLVQTDLEAMEYALGAIPFPAAGVGAPHIRDRLYWVADANRRTGNQGRENLRGRAAGGDAQPRPGSGSGSVLGGLDHPDNTGLEGLRRGHKAPGGRIATLRSVTEAGELGGLADAHGDRQPPGRLPVRSGRQEQAPAVEPGHGQDVRPGPVNGLWRDADWLFCRDGKWRPVGPGTFPLANGAPSRVGRLRAYGNAINAEAAAQFIAAYLEATP